MSYKELAEALDALFDAIPSPIDGEVDDYLREAGYDPQEMEEQFARVAEEAF